MNIRYLLKSWSQFGFERKNYWAPAFGLLLMLNWFNNWKCQTLKHFKIFRCCKCSKYFICFKSSGQLLQMFDIYKCKILNRLHTWNIWNTWNTNILKSSSVKHFQALTWFGLTSKKFRRRTIILTVSHILIVNLRNFLFLMWAIFKFVFKSM